MRLFAALEVPAALRAEVVERARSLRGGLPKARWSRPEAMHLTLSFLGDTDPALLPDLHRELAAAGTAAPTLELRLHEVGAFPPRRPARVLWIDVADPQGRPAAGLVTLHEAVARAVQRAADVAPEKRAFHPHVTLARCSPPWKARAVETFRADFGEPPAEVFRLEEFVLFESELHPAGARYRAIRAYPLGGGP